MTDAQGELRTITLERDLPHPPAKVWRALTQPNLMSEWLMETDFAPELDRPFVLKGGWGSVACRVVEIEPERRLAYTWEAMGLESVVTFTLTPSAGGVRLRVEQAGFRRDQEQAFRGAHAGWARMLGALEGVLAGEA